MDFRCFNLLSRLSNKDTLIMRRFIPVLIFLSVLALTAPSAALAAGSIVVNTNVDDNTVNGNCTLREAIIAANTDAAVDACAAGSGADTITFAADYTITLNGSQLPAITSQMTITGNGAANTIIEASTCNPVTRAGGCIPVKYRVMEVAATTGDLTLNSVTLRHGQCDANVFCNTDHFHGAGISNAGTLTMNGVTVTENRTLYDAAGIHNATTGTATLNQITVTANSGLIGSGITNYGMMTIQNHSLIGGVGGANIVPNTSSASGPGIYNYSNATMTVDDSVVSGNISYGGGGSGAVVNDGTITIQNNTVIGGAGGGNISYGDWSGGGGLRNGGTAIIDHSEISANLVHTHASDTYLFGGGILNRNTLLVRNNSLITGNKLELDPGAKNTTTWGGGIANDGTTATTIIDDSMVSGNSAQYGAGVVVWNGAVTIQNDSSIGTPNAPNIAAVAGGGVYNLSMLNLTSGATISGNIARYGGGIVADGTFNPHSNNTTISGGIVGGINAGNHASLGGGVYAATSSLVTVAGGEISYNEATDLLPTGDTHIPPLGGGLYVDSTSSAAIDNGQIIHNLAASNHLGKSAAGGGIYVAGDSINHVAASVTVQSNSLIGYNQAAASGVGQGTGGGIKNFGAVTITGSRVISNVATTSGSALMNETGITPSPSVQVTGSCISANTGIAFVNKSTTEQLATGNWWGDVSGPGPVGPSLFGDRVSVNVNFSGFLTSPILGCLVNPRPVVELDTTSVGFGNQAVKTISLPRSVTVHNTGDSALMVSSAIASGGFSILNDTCVGAAVAPGDTCVIAVAFRPATLGLLTGILTITSNSASSPDTVSLSGNGRTGTPALGAPKDGSASLSQLPKFSWKAPAGAIGYHIQIDTAPTFDSNAGSPLFEADQPTTSTTWTGAPLALGTYYWRVQAVDPIGPMGYTLPYTFDVTLLKTPAKNGAVSQHLPKFAWQAVKGATGYHLQVFDTQPDCAAGTAVHFEKDTATTSYTMKAPDPALEMGSYYWRVTANGGAYTPCWRFDVTTLKAPKNGGSSLAAPKFSWAANKAATGYQITVTLVPDDGSGDIVKIDHKAVTTPSYAALPADGLSYGHYLWHIEEVLGVAGPPTPDFSFYITNMTKPLPGTFSLDTTPTFTWKAIKGETGYTLEIAQVADFSTILHSYDAGAKTTYTVPPADALGQGTYYWRVRTTGPGNFVMPGWTIVVGP